MIPITKLMLELLLAKHHQLSATAEIQTVADMAIIGLSSARALRYMTHMVVISDNTHMTMTNEK